MSKDCLIHYRYVEDKPQKVIGIFHGREMPWNIPCIIIIFENIVEIELNFEILTSPLYDLEADLMSEETFRYKVLQHFINFDETQVIKSSKGDKSGPWAATLTNPDLLQAGTRVFKDPGGHVTGIF